jgi:hypothetical protein
MMRDHVTGSFALGSCPLQRRYRYRGDGMKARVAGAISTKPRPSRVRLSVRATRNWMTAVRTTPPAGVVGFHPPGIVPKIVMSIGRGGRS